ncbi:MAG: TolC family protein, partial [Stellaceae bacterium]
MMWGRGASARGCERSGAGCPVPVRWVAPAAARRWLPVLFRGGVSALAVGLSGCASYEALPLPQTVTPVSALARLDLNLPPQEPGQPPTKVDPTKPLTPDQVALLAMVNNPDLASLRAKIAVADADLFAARLLPNPSVSFGYAFLVSGPATQDSVTASISQDIRSIVTYAPKIAAAKDRARQVAADSLWQEWQVAQ